jgi:hypothetical protein
MILFTTAFAEIGEVCKFVNLAVLREQRQTIIVNESHTNENVE